MTKDDGGFEALVESVDEAVENGDVEAAVTDLVGAALLAYGTAARVKEIKKRLRDVLALIEDTGDFDDDEDTADGEE